MRDTGNYNSCVERRGLGRTTTAREGELGDIIRTILYNIIRGYETIDFFKEKKKNLIVITISSSNYCNLIIIINCFITSLAAADLLTISFCWNALGWR
jgi:hypothetical protein